MGKPGVRDGQHRLIPWNVHSSGRITGNLEPDKSEDKNNSLPLSGLTASGAGGSGDGNVMTNRMASHHEFHILDV